MAKTIEQTQNFGSEAIFSQHKNIFLPHLQTTQLALSNIEQQHQHQMRAHKRTPTKSSNKMKKRNANNFTIAQILSATTPIQRVGKRHEQFQEHDRTNPSVRD
jgi:hypothetical protein